MCRLAAYNGSPLALASLTHAPPHSLLVQSYRPRQMREAVLNADGVGAAWYPDDGDPRPCRYRNSGPMWSDENLEQLASRIRSSMLLAVVRSATPGLAVGPASTPPYVHGPVSFMHNGYLEHFRKSFMRPVRDLLSDSAHEVVLGGTDTEHIFGLFLDALGFSAAPSTDAMVGAMHRTIDACTKIAQRSGSRAVLNLMASNGHVLVASRYSSAGPTGTLYSAEHAGGFEEGAVAASEPLTEDPAWVEVPEDTLLIIEQGRMRSERLR